MTKSKAELGILELVEQLGLRDVSELKTYCQVRLKITEGNSTSEFPEEFIGGYTLRGIIKIINDEMKVMTLPEYLNETPRTLNDLGSQEKNEMHMVLGLVTEAGEVADAYKRNFAYGTDLDRINVSEELGGDTMWYIANWYNISKYSIYRSMFSNIAKLKVRYPVEEGYSNERAISRDLETERKTLEENLEK